ncbi:MAG: hypothetical protein ACI841_000357 [Planctomycetota bacterium]|jgi:hypothetical protein
MQLSDHIPSYFSIPVLLAAGLAFGGSASANDLYFAGSDFGQILRGNAAQGDFAFLGACGGPAQSMCLDDEDLFIGDQSGRIYHFDSSLSAVVYAFDSANDATSILLDGADLLVGGSDATVLRYSKQGTLIQTLTPPVSVDAMLLDGSMLYVGSSQGAVFQANLADGIFSFWGTCGGPIQSMAHADGSMFLGTTSGVIYRLDEATQLVDASFAAGNDARALAIHMGDLLSGGSDGSIRRIAPDDGRLFATIDGGFDVEAIAVSEEAEPGTGYCYGGVCACGNHDSEAGCANTTGAGAKLRASGSTSVTDDDLFFTLSGLPTGQFGVMYMGAAQNSLTFGNGILCAGAGGYGQFRFPVQGAGAGGFMSLGLGVVAHSHTHFSVLGQITAGQNWNFQAWYRDPGGACGSSFNTSNGYSVTFQP